MHRTIAFMPALVAACATSSPTSHSTPPAPDPASIPAFFDALKARDSAKVERMLVAQPGLAAAHRADGTSAVLVALSTVEDQAFVHRKDNQRLASILARRPPLDPFEAAVLGDRAAVAAALERDPAFVRAVHAPPLGWTALHFAAFGAQVPVVELLLARGADVNARAKTKFHNTPLQVALLVKGQPAGSPERAAQVEVVHALIRNGADVDVKQSEGFTALHEAALQGTEEIVSILLDAGADVNAKGGDGRTPLDLALKAEHSTVVGLLQSRGAVASTSR